MSSSSPPLGTSEDASMVFSSCLSSESAVEGDNLTDVLQFPNLQLNDRSCPKGDSLLHPCCSTSKQADKGTTINDLSDKLILEIFSYMSINENINVLRQVCTRWKTLAVEALLGHPNKYVVRYETSENEAIRMFAAIPQLQTVILQKDVSPAVFKALARRCPHLTTLKTNLEQMLTYSDADNLFNGCKKIRSLTISYTGFCADMRLMNAVARLAYLQVLHVMEYRYKRHQIPLHILADGCPHLYDLELGSYYGICYRIQDAEYFTHSHKQVLKRLKIRWTSTEQRSIIPLLSRVDTLQNLELIHADEYVGIEGLTEGLNALGQLQNVRQLCFGVREEGHLLPAVFENGRLLNLQRLQLSNSLVDKVLLAVAEHCPELRELELRTCVGHTDALLKPLCQLEKLEKLKIDHCKCLGGKAMSYIAKLPALHTLEFAFIDFAKLKQSIECILEMSGLHRLHLYGSDCFAIPFEEFPGRLVNLRELNVVGCDGDQEGLDRACAEMPYLKVEGTLGNWLTDEF